MLPLNLFAIPRKVIIAAALGCGALILATIMVVQAPHSGGHTSTLTKSAAGVATLSDGPAVPKAPAAGVESTPPMQELHIANNGLVLLRGAKVMSISGNVLRVGLFWDSRTITWEISTRFNTVIYAENGQKEKLSDIKIGDIITVTGTLNAGGLEQSLAADYIHQ